MGKKKGGWREGTGEEKEEGAAWGATQTSNSKTKSGKRLFLPGHDFVFVEHTEVQGMGRGGRESFIGGGEGDADTEQF